MHNNNKLFLSRPSWEVINTITGYSSEQGYSKHFIFIFGAQRELDKYAPVLNLEKLGKDLNHPQAQVCVYVSGKLSIDSYFIDVASFLTSELKKIALAMQQDEQCLVQVLGIDFSGFNTLYGLASLFKSLHIEHPNITGQVIEFNDLQSSEQTCLAFMSDILSNAKQRQDNYYFKYDADKCKVQKWHRIEHGLNAVLPAQTSNITWQEDSTYVISGGLGGIGKILCASILKNTKNSHVVLLGQREMSSALLDELGQLDASGRTQYYQINLCDLAKVEDLIRDISKFDGPLKGVMHAAGCIQDSLLVNKSTQELERVLKPKVAGVVNLDLATREVPLDFFIAFSSLASVSGNAGQLDYACANGFVDSYIQYRHSLRGQQQRQGKSLSINWPIWAEGGMSVSSSALAAMKRKAGIVPISTVMALDVIDLCLQHDIEQVLPVYGDTDRFLASFERGSKAPQVSSNSTDKTQFSQVLMILKQVLSEETKEPVERINIDKPFEKQGIDSVMAMAMTDKLEGHFGSLSKTLFFEHRNLKDLAKHLQHCGIPLLADDHEDAPHLPTLETTYSPSVSSSYRDEDIAIIGLSGRFPDAPTVTEFWHNLERGHDAIGIVPALRWNVEEWFDDSKNNPLKSYSKWGGFLGDVTLFDAEFFDVTAAQALVMDPQERLFLEIVWLLLEQTGHSASLLKHRYNHKVGTYVGSMTLPYQQIDATPELAAVTSLATHSIIANRVSYFFDLQGPSVAVDTMCSSSLSAVDLACNALRNGDCRLAIAGAVNLSLERNKYIGLSRAGALASHEWSRSFSDGDGYIPAEGVGAVLLKPLRDAQRDEDTILAVIKASSTNHGGRSNGFAVPNVNAQAQLIVDNIRRAGVDPSTINYIECASNGSALGDPIEITALKKAFNTFTQAQQFCAIGAVKASIGHAEAASGMSQLAKVLLQLKHGTLVKTLLSDTPNMRINLSDSPFYLQTKTMPWHRVTLQHDGQDVTYPRRAAISSFGDGGSNAHLILEEYVSNQVDPVEVYQHDAEHIFPVSARTRDELQKSVSELVNYIGSSTLFDLKALSDTLRIGRNAMRYRIAVVCQDRDALLCALKNYLRGEPVVNGVLLSSDNDSAVLENLTSLREADEDELLALCQRQPLAQLGRYWVNGVDVPWIKLNATERFTFLTDLPSYPFTKAHYWVGDYPNQSSQSAKALTTAVEHKANVSILHILKEMVSQLMSVDAHSIDVHRNLAEIGFDSIKFTLLCDKLNERFTLQLLPTIFYQFGSLKALEKYLHSEHDISAAVAHHDAEAKPTEVQLEKMPIAICGVSVRLPQANDIEKMWTLLCNGSDTVTEVPASRFDWRAHYGDIHSDPSKSLCQWHAQLAHIEQFDPLFFEISPLEAATLDPRARLLLENAWHALEDAAIGRTSHVGVFIGAEPGDYDALAKQHHKQVFNSDAMLASRIAYFMNFQGPVFTINTTCSSGLMAAHQACQSLRAYECEVALVGAANLNITPRSFMIMSNAGALAKDGKCKAFDSAANGVVLGEAVVVLALKRLNDALDAGHPIYAVIEGNKVNNDGKTNGITAPSEQAQSALMAKVYKEFNIDVQQIGHIVTHGTGTRLGDSIEINALQKVFQTATEHVGGCGLSSTKINFGHSLAASGLVSLVALTQSIKTGIIPPAIHLKQLNDYVDWQSSPFFVPTTAQAWRLKGRRLGAVSAFGMTGTNVHMVLGEAPSQQDVSEHVATPQLLVFSAKSPTSLRQKLQDMANFFTEKPDIIRDLSAIARTLIEGRHHFKYRCAVIVQPQHNVSDLFTAICAEDAQVAGVYWGFEQHEVEEHSYLDTLSLLSQATSDVARIKLLHELAQLYCVGADPVSEQVSHRENMKVRLPVYPFEHSSHWLDDLPTMYVKDEQQKRRQVHPLLADNISRLGEQTFVTSFDAQNVLLKEHHVGGVATLPGSVHIEMAIASLQHATNALVGVRLNNLYWQRPLQIKHDTQNVCVSLVQKSHDSWSFKTFAEHLGEEIEYCCGSLQVLSDRTEQLDLSAIVERCQREAVCISKFYEAFSASGVQYGKAFQCVQAIDLGQRELVARLELDDRFVNNVADYAIHPTLLDGALQTCQLLVGEGTTQGQGALLYAIDSVEFLKPCSSTVSVWAKQVTRVGQENVKFDLLLSDEHGCICVKLIGVCARKHQHLSKQNVASDGHITTLTGRWKALTSSPQIFLQETPNKMVVLSEQPHQAIAKLLPQAHILPVDFAQSVQNIQGSLEQVGELEHIFVVFASQEVQIETQSEAKQSLLYLFNLAKALQGLSTSPKKLTITLVTNFAYQVHDSTANDPGKAMLHGLATVMAKEYPYWHITTVDLEDSTQLGLVLQPALELPAGEFAYREGEWYQKQLVQVDAPMPVTYQGFEQTTAFKQNGVYVLIGGAGGIGQVVTEHLLVRYQAQVIWLGRSVQQETLTQAIEALSRLGKSPVYYQCDASNLAELQRVREEIISRFGRIDGVIQSAIGELDSSIGTMCTAQFLAALSPKFDVSLNTALAFSELSLDFMLFFSSLASFACESGTASYSAGGIFQDELAKYLNAKANFPVKVLNWGVWDRIGVANAITDETRNRLAMSGVGVISASQGMQVLEQCLAMPLVQLAAINLNEDITHVFGEVAVTDKYLYQRGDDAMEENCWLNDIRQVAHSKFTVLKQSVDEQDARTQKEIDSAIYRQVFALLRPVLFADADTCSLGSLVESEVVAGTHAQWLAHMLVLFEQNGYVRSSEQTGDGIYHLVAQEEALQHPTWQVQSEQWQQIPHFTAQVRALNAVFKDLVSVLKGDKLGTDVLFPDGSDDLVAGLYQNNLLSDYFNDLVTLVVEHYLRDKLTGSDNVPLRILEVGAGTGATSKRVLKALESYHGHIAEYLFTDISPALVSQAKTQLGDLYPFVTCQYLDIERALVQQNIEIGQYDIVIATNVIHATSSVRLSLQNVKAALKNQGLLILNESITNKLFAHLTFGLLDGWWAFKDGGLRQSGSPLLDAATWLATLNSEGFSHCDQINVGVNELGQEIFVACSNGVSKQNITAKEAIAWSKIDKPPVQTTNNSTQLTHVSAVNVPQTMSHQHSAEAFVKHVISTTLRIPVSKLDSQETFDKYGIDSILVVKLTNLLSEKLGQEVSSTLFFEYQTIAALAQYLLSEFASLIIPQQDIQGTQAIEQPPKEVAEQNINTQQDKFALNKSQDIAVIGLAGRYPKANNIQQLWENLCAGKNCVDEVPASRWNWQEYYSSERGRHGFIYSKWGGFVDDVEQFDSLFFKISPRDAQVMDPQGRLFLQEAYHCIEDAGYTPSTLSPKRNVGVFVGITNSTYPTGADYSSVANRVSYCLNLFGPSVAFDTACSSSLTATHFAISSIRNGDCDCAIVGGVNLVLDPIHYIGLSAMTMLSDGPNCKAFGADADGFVDAEGVGAMLLKPLAQAQADRDHIYGVIKASAINSGGHTHGYTVPNPNAQQQLITDALRRSEINAETLSYLEAHGTGTLLGDPIEIKALTKAFRHDTQKVGYCAIGSIKSNIGHGESAAGIAGITKVLLQLKHKKLVPTLHAEQENPKIDFANSPFVVQKQLSDWRAPTVLQRGRHVEVPRRAGLSSFGAGGANAHLILEECPSTTHNVVAFSRYCVLLSARDETRLQQQASQLLAWLEQPHNSTISLASLAYTLQVGREAMQVRAGLLVANMDELSKGLIHLVKGTDHAEIYRSEKTVAQPLNSLFEDADLNDVLHSWVRQGKLHKLVEAWVQGVSVDWTNLYSEHERPYRISLPGYPFAPESHWVPRQNKVAHEGAGLHPMVQRNVSDLSAAVKFRTTLTGAEFFIKDHQVNGHFILPAAAYLEMFRASASLVWEQCADTESQLAMTNLIWLTPMKVDTHGLDIEIKVEASTASELAVSVHHHDIQTLYCQGNIQRLPFSQQDILDLAAIKARCSHAVIDGAHCYETYQACGVQFGPSLRATDTIYSGANEALAKLQLPTALAANLAGYHLHPSILDAALQAISGIKALDEQMQTGGPLVPFALERIEILGTCSAQMWSWARLAEQDKHKQVTKFDIELCDDQGVVCVRMRGFSARVLSMDTPHQSSENHLYHPVWELSASEQSAAVAPLCVLHKGLSPEVEAGLKDRDIEVSKLSDGDYETVVCEVIERFQQLLASKATGLVQVVISAAEMESGWYGLSGLLRSVMQESPHLHAQLIGLDEVQCSELSACLEALADNSKADPQESVVCYEDNQKKVLSWRASEEPSALNVQQVWRSGCSYLISGGLGGLGQIFAQEILKGSSTAEVILLGRSPARLGWQEAFGVEQGRVHYYQVDIADKASLAEVLKEIRSRHTKVKGVLHSAGVVKDNYLIKKSSEEVMSVLSAKVSGLENLDTLTSAYELEFFVAFSSMAGVLGNAGQGDYAAANAYMDGYMRQRAQAVATGKRYGISLSIAWPLWQEGGMTVDSETLALTMGKLGLLAMPTESGIKAFYEALAMNHANVLVEHRQHQIARYTDEAAILCTLLCELLDVLATELEFDSSWQELGCDQLKLSWLAEQVQLQLGVSLELNQFHEFDTPAKVLQYIQSSHKGLGLKGKVRIEQEQQDDRSSTEDSLIALLTRIVGKHIGMAAERIAVDDEFEQFGIDSVTMLKMTSELEQEFGSLPKTLFFEYKSIEQLSEYFSEYHDAVLATWRNPVHATATQATARASFDVSQAEPHRVNNEAETADDLSACERLDITAQDIAVIGIAGQYPGADGLDEFWLNLLNGVDSISPVPQSRWAHEDYYDSDKRVVGKTYAKWGGFIDDFDKFDPLFFNISPREANGIDPQERLFLQTAYHALEDAGYNPMTFNQQGTVGVYAGVMYEEYQLYGQVMPDFSFVLPGNPSAIANRVSFYFNLTGPSLAVDSMCSSSLTTIHLACQSIRSQECDAAIAGGVNLSLHPNKFLLLAQGGFAASQPGCRSFGEGGDGYVPGEGVGAVVLKPLAKAMADNDAIHVIIKGSAINHGGRANGYSVPDPLAQAQVIRKAYDNANVDVATVSYIEAHGTGTSLGDPIEVEALRKVFGQHGQQRLMLGSVKSNVGHCESAAGIAGLTKVILQMKHAKVVPSLHSKVLNPNINFAELPFHVPQEVQEWPRMLSAASRVMSRRAGISAFGAGGANAHLVVEEYIAMQPESVIAHEHCIILSAKTRDALVQKARDLSEALQTQTLNLRDVAYTLQCGREAMSERLAFVADSVQVCIDNLSAFVDGNEADWVLGKADKSMRNQCLDEQVLAELAPHELKITLQSHWLKGGKVQWQQCYASQPAPQKCHLPLYPFEKRRCWYTKLGAPSVKQAAVSIPASSDEDIESANIQPVNLGYSWHVKALAPSMARTIGSTLILATSDTQELARNIARRIDVVHVLEVDALGLNGVAEIGYYQNVIDVCGCSKTKIDELVWFELVQSLVRDNHKSGLHMMAVTHMTHQLNANDEVVEEGAMQAALYTLLQEEYQGVSSWTVDIDSRLSEPALAQLLWGEFTQQQPDNVVAYRQAQRYVASLETQPIILDQTNKWVLPDNQVLLITGGTSGLGYLCAKHCVEKHGVKKLVLTGRDVFPDKTQWQQYVVENSDRMSEKIKAIQALEMLGAQVQVHSVCLSDQVQVRNLLDSVMATMGEIAGVVHCAGNVDFHTPAFIRKTPATVQAVLEPKVQGLKVLLKEVQNQPLQFVLCYSSISALMPELAVGQLDYAMANYYMDQIATVSAGTLPLMSVQWSSWSQSGMAKSQSQRFKQSGLVALSDDDGLALFDDAVAKIMHQGARGVYAPVLVDERFWQRDQAREVPATQSHRQAEQHSVSLGLSQVAQSVLAWLTELFSEELQVEQDILEPDTSFQEVGVDSILIAQFINRMEAELGTSLDPGIIIEHASLGRLTQYIVSTFPEHCATLCADQPQLETTDRVSQILSHVDSDAISVTSTKRENKGSDEGVAVIGLGCHFPGANDAQSFWENLKAGKDCVTDVPVSRQALYQTQGHEGPMWGAFLEDIEYFDSQYFNLKPDEVVQIDPLIRQWLEVSAIALNDAGYDRDMLRGRRVGVYAGARTGPFAYHAAKYGVTTGLAGTAQNFISNYLAHVYDLRGPNMVVDTACSSALTAVHLAAQSIKSGESDIAVAGGVDVLLDSTPFLTLGAAKVLSPDGRCKTFDESANGIALGEGCGVVVLKRLRAAIDDGNKIYAVIEGSAINNDGNTMGITTPNPDAQKQLLELAIADAKVDAATISYVETHGTGTQIGDPLELKALSATLGSREQSAPRCGVGSVKSNIGHLLSAAGAASLIKVLLSITNKELPPTLHCKKPNPRFNFSDSGLYVVQAHQPWLEDDQVLRAGISSFGLGGCNAHIIVSNAGIPAQCIGTMEPRKPQIKFNKSRYWIHNVIEEGTNNLYNANAGLKEKNNEYEEELVDFFDFH